MAGACFSHAACIQQVNSICCSRYVPTWTQSRDIVHMTFNRCHPCNRLWSMQAAPRMHSPNLALLVRLPEAACAQVLFLKHHYQIGTMPCDIRITGFLLFPDVRART